MSKCEPFRLQDLQDLEDVLMHWAYHQLVSEERRLPIEFWLQYNAKQQAIGLCASLLLWVQSGHQELPCVFQLKATIAIMSDQDSLVDVGAGAGKTLCMILPCLLAPTTVSVVFSPLKHLQAVQVLMFSQYNIKVIAINKDTPDNIDLWKDQNFASLIWCVHVDEAHFIYTAGLKHYDIPAFRPAWGCLGEFQIKIGCDVPLQALSGMQPPHIKAAIIKNLLFEESELCTIKLTSNRPNIVYATHPIISELLDFHNIDFLVPRPYPAGWILPKTIDMQKKGLIMHYHGSMSKEYLTQVYEDFSKPNGHCRVLHATEGASTGLDIPDITIVIQYGLTREVPTALQRGGQGGHSPTSKAIFLLMYKPWVKTIDLAAAAMDTASDPDHPTVSKLTDRSTKKEHSGVAMIKIIQLEQQCLRKLYASYLSDTTPDEIVLPIRNKRKAGTNTRAMSQHEPLISWLLAWGIKTLSRLHPLNVTHPVQVVEALDETQEWQDLWSSSLFCIIQAYDREITEHHTEETAPHKARQKRTRHKQDLARFAEESAETAEKICQEVLHRYASATAGRS
ncbi:hypothetical protein EI94DRAFT_1709581 [Lactarius quietus]|nr:hypothetical protein EI94DRAFT_1709581 [Lactarius quietus]